MKVIYIIIITALLICVVSCQENIDSESLIKDISTFNMFELAYIEETLEDFTSEKVVGRSVFLNQADTAENVVKELLPIWKEAFHDQSVKDQLPVSVMYDSENEMWLVMSAGECEKGEICGTLYSLISKKDGSLVAIWGTE